jgi:hypothetical protein
LQQQTVDALHLLQNDPVLAGQAFVDSMLAAHPVAVLCRLLVWLQQRPKLLQLPALAADEHAFAGHLRIVVGLAIRSVTAAETSAGQLQRLRQQLPPQGANTTECSMSSAIACCRKGRNIYQH